jgi:hypothetical protein
MSEGKDEKPSRIEPPSWMEETSPDDPIYKRGYVIGGQFGGNRSGGDSDNVVPIHNDYAD